VVAVSLAFVKTFNVSINYSGKGVTRDENSCTHCGHCITHCPTNALRIDDKTTREVIYSEADCIECLACIRVCPFSSLASAF
jgi:ferredoxin